MHKYLSKQKLIIRLRTRKKITSVLFKKIFKITRKATRRNNAV